MNGAECGSCGYITCECDRIAKEKEESKDKTIAKLSAENKEVIEWRKQADRIAQIKQDEAKKLQDAIKKALRLLSPWLSDAHQGKHVCSDTGTLSSVEQALKGQ